MRERTGRMFTGDRSGDFLYAALFRAGLASQPMSTHRGDGLSLSGVFITAPRRCAPPENKPSPTELAACKSWLDQELLALTNARVYLALGRISYDAVDGLSRPPCADGGRAPRDLPAFAHDVEARIPDLRGGPTPALLFSNYHVSQQNTQTGRLTPAMFDEMLRRAAQAAGL